MIGANLHKSGDCLTLFYYRHCFAAHLTGGIDL